METKKINKYKINFKSDFSVEDNNQITMVISIDDELRKILKASIADGDQLFDYVSGESETGETVRLSLVRYKVRTVIYNAVYTDYKKFLFCKELVDDGKMEIKFLSYEKRDYVKNGIKEGFKQLLEGNTRARIDETVSYNIREAVR